MVSGRVQFVQRCEKLYNFGQLLIKLEIDKEKYLIFNQ